MRVFHSSDDEKLLYTHICLEGNARYWFYDGGEIFTTCSSFVQRFMRIFGSSNDLILFIEQFCSSEQEVDLNTNNVVSVAQCQSTADRSINQQDIARSCNTVKENICVIDEHGGADLILDE